MARELKDIELKEVSLVDKAANKKKFLFFKQEGKQAAPKKLKKKINIVIDSDGTIGGTKIVINKDEIKNMRDFNFSFWSSDDISKNVSCSYSRVVETEDGFSRSETFYLSKGDSKMNKDIEKQLKDYFSENEEVDFEKASDDDSIAKALETVNEYKGDFPDDLKKAVGLIAMQSGLYMPQKIEKKEDKKTDVEKAGAKLSKDTLKKIQDALLALKSILPELKANTEKSSGVEKSVEELRKQIEQLENKEDDDTKDELTKTLAELTKRLETVEKGTGVKKSIESQDNNSSDNDGKKWPSFSG